MTCDHPEIVYGEDIPYPLVSGYGSSQYGICLGCGANVERYMDREVLVWGRGAPWTGDPCMEVVREQFGAVVVKEDEPALFTLIAGLMTGDVEIEMDWGSWREIEDEHPWTEGDVLGPGESSIWSRWDFGRAPRHVDLNSCLVTEESDEVVARGILDSFLVGSPSGGAAW